MKRLALIALTMVLGLSGCASSGTGGSIGQDWTAYWWNRGGPSCESVRQDWIRYWNDPGGASWESVKQDWVRYWNDRGGAFLGVSKTGLDQRIGKTREVHLGSH